LNFDAKDATKNGPIAACHFSLLLQSKFRERFVAKGRYQGYLEKIATALITSTDVALNGAAKSIAQKA
jgi:glucokinase